MKITFEKTHNLSLIYIKLREYDDKVETIEDAMCELLFDKDNNWIGINIFNSSKYSGEFIIPSIKNIRDVNVEQTDERVTLLFNQVTNTYSKREWICNVDHNKNGFFGIELMLTDFNCNVEVIKPFTVFR